MGLVVCGCIPERVVDRVFVAGCETEISVGAVVNGATAVGFVTGSLVLTDKGAVTAV